MDKQWVSNGSAVDRHVRWPTKMDQLRRGPCNSSSTTALRFGRAEKASDLWDRWHVLWWFCCQMDGLWMVYGWFMDGFVALINESPRLRHQKSAIYKTASLVCSDLAKNRVRLGNPARLTPNMADNRNPADHFKDVSTWLNPVHFVLIFFMD